MIIIKSLNKTGMTYYAAIQIYSHISAFNALTRNKAIHVLLKHDMVQNMV